MYKSLRWILLIYGLLSALFYGYQQYFFFRPKALPTNYKYQFAENLKYSEATIPFDSANQINVVRFLPVDPAKGVVLFFHGNRSNIVHYSRYAPYFTKLGYECWMPDYPGYGKSTGELTIEMLQKISLKLYKMARVKYRPDQITIYGKSIGTGIAAYLASERDCRNLVLETPYYSLASVASEYVFFLPVDQLMKYNLKTHEYLDKVTAPVTVLHGDKDQLIPLANASRLVLHMKLRDAFYVIIGGNHNNLAGFKLFHQVLDSVLSK